MLHLLLAGTLAATQPAPRIEISSEVRAVVAKYGKEFGPDAERELKSLSDAGDAAAAALLGEIMRFPTRIGGPDFASACDYSEKAPAIASAVHNVATCYFAGSGRPKNFARARELYAGAAELGMVKSKCALGNMLVHGEGGPADPARGIQLCREAADTGDPDAQTDYAGYLLTNKYAPKDAARARSYLLPAAEKGHANAAFLLAQTYWYGDGVEKNVPQAAIWWLKAYERGRADAAFWVGYAAFGQVLDAAKSKQPIATSMISQAEKWLAVAAAEDPDQEKRSRAKELQGLLERLLANRKPA